MLSGTRQKKNKTKQENPYTKQKIMNDRRMIVCIRNVNAQIDCFIQLIHCITVNWVIMTQNASLLIYYSIDVVVFYALLTWNILNILFNFH